jgi:hypothetical protein
VYERFLLCDYWKITIFDLFPDKEVAKLILDIHSVFEKELLALPGILALISFQVLVISTDTSRHFVPRHTVRHADLRHDMAGGAA